MMEKIFLTLLEQGADVLATRMSAEQAEELLPKFPSAHYNPIGRTFRISHERAGTSSSPAEARCEKPRPRGHRHRRHERPARGRGGPRNGPLDRRRA